MIIKKIKDMDFKKYLNLNIKKKNKNKVITLSYAFAITVAFILSLTNNNAVNASISPNEDFDYIVLEENISNNLNYNANVFPDDSIDNIKSLFDAVNSYKKEVDVTKTITIKSGDNFISILNGIGIGYSEANKIFNKLKKHYNPTRLRIGHNITINAVVNNNTQELIKLNNIIISPDVTKRIILSQNENLDYVIKVEKDELVEEVNYAQGTINGTLSTAMQRSGVPSRIVNNFINIFAYSIDFRRDVRKGDTFELVYENQISPDGKIVKSGNILYASLNLKVEKVSLYSFKDSKGKVDFYDEKGKAKKKMLYKKPLAFQAARISSPFGKRRHPVLGDIRIHWGVDYAAPRGSAIFAAGDGVVKMAKYNGAYGNYIKIRHNNEFSSAYGHMRGFAKGIRAGKRVKQGQVIGYIGTTGRSTGPHLHYEVIRYGKRVNPRTIKAATGENLNGRDLRKFKTAIVEIKKTYEKQFAKNSSNKVAKK